MQTRCRQHLAHAPVGGRPLLDWGDVLHGSETAGAQCGRCGAVCLGTYFFRPNQRADTRPRALSFGKVGGPASRDACCPRDGVLAGSRGELLPVVPALSFGGARSTQVHGPESSGRAGKTFPHVEEAHLHGESPLPRGGKRTPARKERTLAVGELSSRRGAPSPSPITPSFLRGERVARSEPCPSSRAHVHRGHSGPRSSGEAGGTEGAGSAIRSR